MNGHLFNVKNNISLYILYQLKNIIIFKYNPLPLSTVVIYFENQNMRIKRNAFEYKEQFININSYIYQNIIFTRPYTPHPQPSHTYKP